MESQEKRKQMILKAKSPQSNSIVKVMFPLGLFILWFKMQSNNSIIAISNLNMCT